MGDWGFAPLPHFLGGFFIYKFDDCVHHTKGRKEASRLNAEKISSVPDGEGHFKNWAKVMVKITIE